MKSEDTHAWRKKGCLCRATHSGSLTQLAGRSPSFFVPDVVDDLKLYCLHHTTRLYRFDRYISVY